MLNTIIHADCLDIMREMPDKSVDLILSDPPYGISYKTRYRKEKNHKFSTVISGDDNLNWLPLWASEANRVLKNNSALYVFCGQTTIGTFQEELTNYFTLKNIIVWEKNNHTAGDLVNAYGKSWEPLLYFNKGVRPINGKRIHDIFKSNRISSCALIHQNQKPCDLIELILEKSSHENNTILDPFSGSGTTAIACHNLKRNFICIEKDVDYHAASVKRLEHHQRQGILAF